jgi:phage-related baseplate assembly protein
VKNIDFSSLPPPSVIESIDFDVILAAMKADLVSRAPEFNALVESDPAMKILEVCAYRETLLRARVNDAARSVLLAHATGTDLDNLAALYNVARKVVTPANESTVPPRPAVMESDTELRRRVLLSLDGLATAGARNAYVFHALSVPGVLDASVSSPPDAGIPPGHVHVHVLSTAHDGVVPADLLSAVSAALNKETVRPLTDIVTVYAGQVRPFAIRASLWLYPGPDAAVVLANANAGAMRYVDDNFRLGRDITLSGLYAALHVPGVQRVELSEPEAGIVNSPAQCSRCDSIDITIAGTAE